MTHKTYARITALVAAGFLVTSGSAAFADTGAPGNDCGNAGAQCGDSGPSSPSPTPSPDPEDEEEKEEEDRGDAPGYEESPSGEPSEGEHVPGYEQTPEPPESTEPAEPTEPPEDGESGHGPSDEEDEEEVPVDEPEQPEQHVPGSQASEQHVDRHAGGSTSSTTSPAPDDRDLALTGADASGLVWLIGVAATAIAAGAALVLGLRRRSRS